MRRTVLLTGANGGIGREIALLLAQRGHQVIAATRDEAKAAAVREHLASAGASVTSVLLDLTDPDSCQRALTHAQRISHGRLDTLVNTAGMAMGGAIEDIDDADVHAVLELNLIGPMRLCRLAAPHLRRTPDARVVNISSLAGRVAMPMMGWYCASKHALEAASDALRMELARDGVRVVTIEPGSYATHLWDGVFARMNPDGPSAYADCYRLASRAKPLVRRLPSPTPVARLVARALEAPRPRARYRVGLDARLGVLLDAASPTPAADLAKRAMFGLLTRRQPARGQTPTPAPDAVRASAP